VLVLEHLQGGRDFSVGEHLLPKSAPFGAARKGSEPEP
jgi:hypothetical protein